MDFIYKMKNGINGCFFYINRKSYLSLSIYEIFTFHNIVIILYGFAEIRGAALTARSPDQYILYLIDNMDLTMLFFHIHPHIPHGCKSQYRSISCLPL